MAGIKLLPDLLSHQKSVDSAMLEVAELRYEIAEEQVSIAAAVEEAENENRDPDTDNEIRKLHQHNHDLQTHLRKAKREYKQGVSEYRDMIKKVLPRAPRQDVLAALNNIQQELAGVKRDIAAVGRDVATAKDGIAALQRQQVPMAILVWNTHAYKNNLKAWAKYHQPQGQRPSRDDLLAPLLPIHPDPIVLSRARGGSTFEDKHSDEHWTSIHPDFGISDTSLVCVPPKIAFHDQHKLFPRTVSDLLSLSLTDLMDLEAIYEERFGMAGFLSLKL
ncbi:hypothetical protein GGF32_008787 [Allomyces javanicus]|nr:hypothetical protein GGF32_008787 [Allomyces javanicus]